jgi:hypothetical protein
MMANLKTLLSIIAVIAIGKSKVASIRSMRYLLIVVLDLLASSGTMCHSCLVSSCGFHVILHCQESSTAI